MEDNQHYRKQSLVKALKTVYQNYGISGLYAGW